MKKSDVIFGRTFQGAWRLTAEIDGVFESRQYLGYTKQEAWQEFREEFKTGHNPNTITEVR